MPPQPKCADDLEVTESEQVFRRFLSVQLNDRQTELFRDIGHFAGRTIDEDSHRGDRAGKGADDRRGLSRLDESR